MPLASILVLTAIVSAFLVFAVALAYGEYQTRHFKRQPEPQAAPQEREQQWLKAA